ncbi:hypothetical protein [Priestia megaterium]|uniref:hypothetical protein n=1 Tax=Priestia megaterium TaxID=1404 RepID=UPI002FFE69E8
MPNKKMKEGLKKFIAEDLEGLLNKLFPLINSECPVEKKKLIDTAVEFIYSAGYHDGAKDVMEAHREMYRVTKDHYTN